MFKIKGVAKENEFELDGFESTGEALDKIRSIAEDFYGIGVDVMFTAEQNEATALGTFHWPDRIDAGTDGEWRIDSVEEPPHVSESMRELWEQLFNKPELYAWHGEEEDAPVTAPSVEEADLDGGHISYRGMVCVNDLDATTYLSELPRWMEVPKTADMQNSSDSDIIGDSNRACLIRDFGHLGVFITVSYGRTSGGTRLAIPLALDIPEELARVVVMLAQEDPVYDDHDYAEREDAARWEDWECDGLDEFFSDVVKSLEKLVDFDEREDFADDLVDRDKADTYARKHGEEQISQYKPDAPGGDHFDLSNEADDLAEIIAAKIKGDK